MTRSNEMNMNDKYIVTSSEYPQFFDHVNNQKVLKKQFELDKQGKLYRYPVNDKFFYVWETDTNKIVTNLSDYNSVFNKRTGYTATYGLCEADDVTWCPLGPEILDLEISVNGCPKVGGKNCRFCYKNNTDAPAKNMSFETFKNIIDKFPKSLYSVAFGITGVRTNPDFPKMLQYCRSIGIIPNYTLSGADINETVVEATAKYCGAVAVSCYEGNKELCYNTIDTFAKHAPRVHVNMHIVLSKGTLNHVLDVLNDLKATRSVTKNIKVNKYNFNMAYKVPQDPRLEHLRHVVFLRIKPVGRASKLDTDVDLDIFKKVITFCKENHIGYGFDSCSAKDVETVMINNGDTDASKYCQSCESTTQSIYVSCDGLMIPCSFCENHFKDRSVNLADIGESDFIREWNNNDVLNDFRNRMKDKHGQCPMFNLSAIKQ